MGKRRFTEDSWSKDPWFRALCTALLQCKTQDEMGAFLRDIGTLSELQAWSERLEVAKQLSKGLSYRQVSANTGASTTTVTRVAKFLENGEGGYRKFLKAHRHHRSLPASQQDRNVPAQTRDSDTVPVPDNNATNSVEKANAQPRERVSMLQKYLDKKREKFDKV